MKILISSIIVFLLVSCRQKNNSVKNLFTDSLVTSHAKRTKTVSTPEDTVTMAAGKYIHSCLNDTTQQFKLVLSTVGKQHTALLVYTPTHLQIKGLLHRDTLNFDKEMNIWSLIQNKQLYGFLFTTDNKNNIEVELINEDYKKEFNICDDDKNIEFTKE